MFRYLAWSWDPEAIGPQTEDRHLREHLKGWQGWSECYSSRGLRVYLAHTNVSANRVYRLPDHTGVLLGTLFRSSGCESSAPLPQLTPLEGQRIAHEGPGMLAREFWGRYVGFTVDTAQRTHRIFRDPTGGLPCWQVRYRNVQVYCSLLDDAAAIGVPKPTIDWNRVAASLAYQTLEVETTAYEEVTQILGGQCFEYSPDCPRRFFFWSPLARKQGPPMSAEAAEGALRETTQDCVRAWASAYPGLILTVSGGIDSTIVLACLRAQKQLRACLHHHSKGADSDERRYARLSAQMTPVPLLEYERIESLELTSLSGMHHFPAPPAPFYDLQHQQTETQVCRQFQAAAIFSGYGGDQLFGADPLLCALSCARDFGLSPALFDVALDAAYVTRLSWWHILRSALRYRYNERNGFVSFPVRQHKTLLMPHVTQQLEPLTVRLTHPLVRQSLQEDPASVHHLNALLVPAPFYGPFSGANDPERVVPLLSQPLIELCIDLPQSLFISAGWDRSLARRAFQGVCPHDIMRRRDKGGVGERPNTVLDMNRTWVQERLLEGQLVQQGIVQRNDLETILKQGLTRLQTTAVEVLEYLFTEAWLERSRAWSQTRMHP